ncbi:baseplate J/gp47 family protein [Sphaerotilus sp.]|uniref:baseplate J/gp47 family protein n=1 Tax=Sphaerotilus sp. TaxID=2093942 RepID=UPI00286D7750|nr:baseplate J/gp47 family protein [Sphaerotilus sp.]
MASPDPITTALIAELGCAQPERDAAARDPASAPLDDRDADGLLNSLRALAPLIRFYASNPATATGNWLPYLPAGSIAALDALAQGTANNAAGGVAPHHALILAFLRQLARPQALLNQFTAEHLQFQMQQVLGFKPLPPRPDRAHVILELKKGAAPLAITPAERFTAGKDALKVEQLFAPRRSTVVGHAQVVRLASVVRDGPRLLFAPVANSADGLGAPLDKTAPRWPPFGRSSLPPAPIGFALASSVLRLAEGERSISLKLRVGGWPTGLTAAAFATSFEAHLSGPAGWLGPLSMTASLAADLLTLTIPITSGVAAIVDHDPAVHLHDFPASLPVIQCLLKPDAALGYGALASITLANAQVAVAVTGLRGLLLESDEATLSPKKAFLPFGPQPVVGSRFYVGCAEALGKPLTSMTLNINWQGAPADLSAHYAHYSKVAQMRNGIGATATWRDVAGASHTSSTVTLLPRLAVPLTQITINASGAINSTPTPATQNLALHASGSAKAHQRAEFRERAQPVHRRSKASALGEHSRFGGTPAFSDTAAATARAGFVTLSLVESLLHSDFRREALEAALPPADIEARKTFVPTLLNEPYTPKIQEITLDYAAQSDASRIADPALSALTDTDVQFFQIDALGLAREQAWLTLSRPWAPQAAVNLLPAHPAAAELMIGLSSVNAGDSVSLLLQLAEGSADPLAVTQKLQWAVLADNAWRALVPGELALDTTSDLRRSGLVACVLPKETTTTNSRAPTGLVWLRASTPAEPKGNAKAACDVIGVFANALEVQFIDQSNDPQRLKSPLPAARITRLKTPLPAIKSIAQPFASFGGALIESDAALARRASERLRHRDRAITPWDIERLVLQAFPAVYRAKCIPHANSTASGTSWLAAGHFMVVVVPDLRHMNAIDPLRPRVDLDTLTRIREHLLARVGPQTQVHVRNPGYRAVQVDFKVRLRAENGLGFNFLQPQIDLALRQALSPWAFDGTTTLGFGGRVLRSALLDFVEDLPDVDFVTDFRLSLEGSREDVAEIVPDAPDVILVSAARHRIEEL